MSDILYDFKIDVKAMAGAIVIVQETKSVIRMMEMDLPNAKLFVATLQFYIAKAEQTFSVGFGA